MVRLILPSPLSFAPDHCTLRALRFLLHRVMHQVCQRPSSFDLLPLLTVQVQILKEREDTMSGERIHMLVLAQLDA